MADDIPQDQTQTTTQDTLTVPPTDQPPIAPSEQPTNPVSSETPNIPNPPNSPNPDPVAPVTPEPQTQYTETKIEEPTPQPEQTPVTNPSETQQPISPPVLDIPALHYPFSGNFSVTFAFGTQSDNKEIKKKFQEWGIVGHNGIDFGLSAGNEVYPCDDGKIIQSGNNGDFGTSITIQHSWGQSIYGHLQETKVKVDDEIQVNKVIGLSGSSGAAFGEHLHFAIEPNNPDLNNGYLGFIDPAPYLSLPSQKEEPKQEPQIPPVEEQKPPEQPPKETKPPETPQQPTQEQPKPEVSQQPPAEEVPPPIKLEPVKLTEQSQISQPPQAPQVNEEEIQKQVDEKLKVELDARRQKANQTRLQKKEDNLTKIFELVQSKRVVSNDEVRDFLHVSQSTATNYLTEMVNRGMLKKEGERGGAKYSI